jgi:hypothetical protein
MVTSIDDRWFQRELSHLGFGSYKRDFSKRDFRDRRCQQCRLCSRGHPSQASYARRKGGLAEAT